MEVPSASIRVRVNPLNMGPILDGSSPTWSGGFLVADWGEEGTGSPPCTVRSRRQESRPSQRATGSRPSQWATGKSPLPVAPPSGRQESRHSRRATGKSPLPAGDRKVATPSGRQESRHSQWATGKSPLPRQESRHSQWATGKSPLPAGDRKVATPGGRQESRHSYSSSRCGGPSQTSSGWAFHHSSRACSWGARHPS